MLCLKLHLQNLWRRNGHASPSATEAATFSGGLQIFLRYIQYVLYIVQYIRSMILSLRKFLYITCTLTFCASFYVHKIINYLIAYNCSELCTWKSACFIYRVYPKFLSSQFVVLGAFFVNIELWEITYMTSKTMLILSCIGHYIIAKCKKNMCKLPTTWYSIIVEYSYSKLNYHNHSYHFL